MENLIDVIKDFYTRNYSGGCLHSILDDGNTDDDCIKSALKDAKQAVEICEHMLLLSEEERDELYNRYDEYRKRW